MKLLKVDTIVGLREKLDSWFHHTERLAEAVSLSAAVGRYLAREVAATDDLPSFCRSVVDGYAVRGADTFGASDAIPAFLECVGEVEMGQSPPFQLKPGETAYVPTGGMIPAGADAAVMVEYTETMGDRTVGIYKPAAPNQNIMNRGDDLTAGTRLFSPGHRIRARDIGALAAVGCDPVLVYRKPRLSIFSTGDELVEAGQIPTACQIRDVNAPAIRAFAEAAGVVVARQAILPDRFDQIQAAVRESLEDSDLVVLSGGSSAGIKDQTAAIIQSLGRPGVVTHGLAIKPGKPTVVGVLAEPSEGDRRWNPPKLVVGLPGHPMSAIIVYQIVVHHFLRQYVFGNAEQPDGLEAELAENIPGGPGRETYQLITLGRTREGKRLATPIRAKSGAISQLVRADGYVVVPADTEGLTAGQRVRVIPIEQGF